MQVSKRLVVKKEIPIDTARDLLYSMDTAMAEYYCQNKDYEKGLKLYRDILAQVEGVEFENITQKYITYSLEYAQAKMQEKKYIEAIEIYRALMQSSGFPITIYKSIGLCMKAIGNADLAIKFLRRFEEVSPDKEDVYIYLADITYSDIKDNVKAIEYYEKALVKNPNNFSLDRKSVV